MKFRVNDNLSFRFVALGVALILWASILGRNHSTVTRDFELQVQLGPNLEMTTRVPSTVRLEIAGPRVAIKKISTMNPVYTVDLTSARAGRQVVRLSHEGVSLPIGARVVNIEPAEFTVQLRVVTPADKE